ncbi:MAG TPA: hypothetical protein VNM38_00775 [Solirubrobacterales bacterium]|nr:hypothetical protein [Solirubrobacterales bacterium]
MSRTTRFAKPVLVALALAVLAVAISACAIFKEGSLQLSQPGGLGSVRVHFALCTGGENSPECHQNEEAGASQYMLGIAVPPGWSPPATITAQPVDGGQPIVYSRNDEVAKEIAEEPGANPDKPWPPAGTEGIGYLSATFAEETGASREWTVDLDLPLPAAADGGSSSPQFKAAIATGWRGVDGTHPADRPVACIELEPGPEPDSSAWCEVNEEGELGTSDLKIGAPALAAVFIGGKAEIAFPFDFASTGSPPPGFGLAAASTLANATLKLSSSTFEPGPANPDTHRSPAGSRSVTVAVPKNAKPGVYDVTLTATTGAGDSVSQTAKLKVTKPTLKLGGVKLNKARGTATLAVKVPGAGTLTVAGKGLVKAKKKAKKAKKLKITVKAKGASKAQLEQLGKLKVKAKLTFKPTSGVAAKKTKSITLKQT